MFQILKLKNQQILYFVVFIVILVSGWFVPDILKRNPEFCISCHLSRNEPLHKKKHEQFSGSVPVNLSGAHRRKAGKDFSCGDCHTGRRTHLLLRVKWLEFYNTVYYFFGNPKEPEKLDPELMPDENCEICHSEIKRDVGTFHGLSAHIPKVLVPCVRCHVSHPAGRKDYFFIEMQRLLNACKTCHPQLSPAFLKILPDKGNI